MTGQHRRWARRLVSPIVLLVIWQVVGVRTGPRLGVPTPADVASAGVSLIWSGELPTDVAMSLVRAAAGFGEAFALAIGIGLCMAGVPRVQTRLDPIVETLGPFSSVALVPLAIVWFGPRAAGADLDRGVRRVLSRSAQHRGRCAEC